MRGEKRSSLIFIGDHIPSQKINRLQYFFKNNIGYLKLFQLSDFSQHYNSSLLANNDQQGRARNNILSQLPKTITTK